MFSKASLAMLVVHVPDFGSSVASGLSVARKNKRGMEGVVERE